MIVMLFVLQSLQCCRQTQKAVGGKIDQCQERPNSLPKNELERVSSMGRSGRLSLSLRLGNDRSSLVREESWRRCRRCDLLPLELGGLASWLSILLSSLLSSFVLTDAVGSVADRRNEGATGADSI